VYLAFGIRFIHHLRYRHILLYRRYPEIEGKLTPSPAKKLLTTLSLNSVLYPLYKAP
jgi:hypothetical protein